LLEPELAAEFFRVLPLASTWPAELAVPGIPAHKSLLCRSSAFSIVGACALALFFLVETQPFQLSVSVALLADITLTGNE
jgi:hypothetical protein